MRTVIFDLDGTLVDSAPDIAAATNRMLLDEGLAPLDLATVTSFIGNGLPKLVEHVIGACGLDMGRHADLTSAVLAYYNRASTDLSELYPNVIEALDLLKSRGFALGVCTNKPKEPADTMLSELDLAQYFDVVIGGDSLAVRKPDAAPLLAAMAQLNAETTIYVGDSEVDAATATAASVPFALFTEGYRKTAVEHLPHTALFSDFAGLPAVIAKIWR